jgi:hypothetical protein
MAIQTNYDFNGLTVPNAYVRIDRLFGSSRENWSALIGVYMTQEIPARPAVGTEGTPEYIPAVPASAEKKRISEFNHYAPYEESVRGYVSMYTSLMQKIGGTEV